MPTPQDIAHEEYMNQLAKNEQVRALADQIVQNAQNGTLPQATATLPRGSVGYGPVEYVTGQTHTNINYDGTAADRGPDAFGNRRGFTPLDGLYTRDQYGNEHRIENRALGAPYEVPGYGPYRGHVVNGLFLDTQAPIRAQLAPLFALAQQAMAQAPRRAAGGVGGGGGVSTPRVRNDAPVSLPQVDLPDDALRARAIENDWYLPRTGTSEWHRKFIEENGLDDQPRLTFNPADGSYTLDPRRGNQAPILESDAPENVAPNGARVARTLPVPGIEGFSVPDVNIPTMPSEPGTARPSPFGPQAQTAPANTPATPASVPVEPEVPWWNAFKKAQQLARERYGLVRVDRGQPTATTDAPVANSLSASMAPGEQFVPLEPDPTLAIIQTMPDGSVLFSDGTFGKNGQRFKRIRVRQGLGANIQ